MRTWSIPHGLWQQTLRELSLDGARGCEGICLWLAPLDALSGAIADTEEVPLTRCAVLRGPLVRRHPLSIVIDSELLSELTDVLDREGLALAGQVHGHPGEFIHLSEVDKAMGFRVPGFLSLVAPHYGVRRETRLEQCGFHEFIARADYRRLLQAEIAQRVRSVEAAVLAPLIIGENAK
jgi:hypothetical protein